jgi:hypothetical protein
MVYVVSKCARSIKSNLDDLESKLRFQKDFLAEIEPTARARFSEKTRLLTNKK